MCGTEPAPIAPEWQSRMSTGTMQGMRSGLRPTLLLALAERWLDRRTTRKIAREGCLDFRDRPRGRSPLARSSMSAFDDRERLETSSDSLVASRRRHCVAPPLGAVEVAGCTSAVTVMCVFDFPRCLKPCSCKRDQSLRLTRCFARRWTFGARAIAGRFRLKSVERRRRARCGAQPPRR